MRSFPEAPMSRFLCAAAVLLVVGLIVPLQAQNEPVDKEDVSFKTFDGVLLKGSFYKSAKGGNSPVVMLLHKFGGSRAAQSDWEKLAVRLQKKGYAVMAFDFRGHGTST